MLQLGVHLPQNELGTDVPALRRFAQSCEAMGYDYLIMGEHVLSHDAASQAPQTTEEPRPYTPDWIWHEPLVLFGYLARSRSGCASCPA